MRNQPRSVSGDDNTAGAGDALPETVVHTTPEVWSTLVLGSVGLNSHVKMLKTVLNNVSEQMNDECSCLMI